MYQGIGGWQWKLSQCRRKWNNLRRKNRCILPWGSSISASIPESHPKSISAESESNGESGLSGRSVEDNIIL